MKITRQAHGLAFSSLLMIVGLFPFGLLSPGAAPKPLYVHAYSPEDIRAVFASEQKQKEYHRVEHIARKLFRSYGCRGDLAPATARSAVDLGLNIRILTALIYLNIAALHHYPYSLLLLALGKSMLSTELDR